MAANPIPDMTAEQFLVTMDVGGESYGFFTTSGGPEGTRESVKIKPGAMTPEVTLKGGTMSVSNLTLTAPYDAFHRQKIPALLSAGLRQDAVVKFFPLDINRTVNGPAIVVSGTLIRAKAPDYAADSTDPAFAEYEVDLGSTVSTA